MTIDCMGVTWCLYSAAEVQGGREEGDVPLPLLRHARDGSDTAGPRDYRDPE